jgi:hypothetical protein
MSKIRVEGDLSLPNDVHKTELDMVNDINDIKSTLIPVEGFNIEFPHPQPNWWWRMWQYILLGWKWMGEK